MTREEIDTIIKKGAKVTLKAAMESRLRDARCELDNMSTAPVGLFGEYEEQAERYIRDAVQLHDALVSLDGWVTP